MVMRERFSKSDRRKLLDSLKEADGRRGPPERGDVVALVAKLREALGSSDLSDSQRAEFAGTLKILEREYEFILGEARPGPGPGGSFTREEKAVLLAALDGGRSAPAPAPAPAPGPSPRPGAPGKKLGKAWEYAVPAWCICPRCKAPKWLVNLACARHGD
jgi:hypothetical protein